MSSDAVSDAPDDLDILAPERAVQAGGRALTVRELTLRQSLDVHARLAPVLRTLAPYYAPGGDGVGVDTVLAALAAAPDVACALLALSTGQDETWIAALPERDGTTLLLTFIAVHIPFFATRLEVARQMTAAQALGKSSPGLSATGMTGPH